jgi:hypothetical protein
MQLKMKALARFTPGFALACAMALATAVFVVATAAPAHAAPDTARSKYKAADKLSNAGADAEALVVIEEGLRLDARYLPLLNLKGSVLVRLRDFEGAYAAYKAFLDAGGDKTPAGPPVKATMKSLEAILATVLEIEASSGPTAITVKDKPFCIASPTCKKALTAGEYTVTAQREGFAPWTGKVTVVLSQTARLEVKLVESPSRLTVKPTPSDAVVTVDGAAFPAPAEVAAGPHQVTVAMVGYATAKREVTVGLGKPVELQVALEPTTPARIVPETATLLLDDQPIALDNGGLSLPAGKRVLRISATGYLDQRVTIPATRPPGYKIDVALVSASRVVRGPLFTPRRKIAVAAAGVSLLAVGAGVYLGVDAKQLEDDSFALCPMPAACPEADRANDLIDRADSRALQANIAFGVAAAAAVGAAVLWITGSAESSSQAQVAITPRLSPLPGATMAGVDLSLTF